MKFYEETTQWSDSMPNGVYLLDDAKEKMYAYVAPGTGIVKTFKSPIRISTKGRKFKVVENTYNYQIPGEIAEQPRWEVMGSKGDKYIVTQTEDGLSCTCSGFKFRGECKHVNSIRDKMGEVSTKAGSVAQDARGLVRDPTHISRRRTG
jgi:hypothetical protein